MKNIEIAKTFKVSWYTVICWKNNHNLNKVLLDPEEDTVVENHLNNILDIYSNIGELYACNILLIKEYC